MKVGLAGPEEIAFLALEEPQWIAALRAEHQEDLGTGLAVEHRLIVACQAGTDDWQVVVDCRLNGIRYSFPFPVRTCEPVVDAMIGHGRLLLCDNGPPNMEIAVTLTVDEKAVAGLRLVRRAADGDSGDTS
jgi:hypothetical protein